MKVLVFEDTPEQAESLLSALQRQLGGDGEAVHFSAESQENETTYEDRLKQELSDQGKYSDVDLIVADRDLSKTPKFRGLSEPTVRRVAELLAIPECSYARSMNEDEYLRSAELREACIAISIEDGWETCASQVASIANGFRSLRETLGAKLKEFSKDESAGVMLATILGKPEYADKMSLYASGDRHRLHSIFHARDIEEHELARHLSCVLGYWLWDSILRYPGVLVNEIAAASYLNIYPDAFSEEEVRQCFSDALYSGPFADTKGSFWWRGALDDIIANGGGNDGRSHVVEVIGRDVRRSECCEDSQVSAGYCCMLSNRPVSLQNSTGGLSWFPRGADLARVSDSQHEELGPWLS